MPKLVDYAGRFACFELASFTLVRDHGVDRLSRHAMARVLATSISTIRRLLDPEADLRRLALNEVAYRRRRRLTPATRATGADAGARLLLPLIPSVPEQVAEELVWWRLVIAAPTTAAVPSDADIDDEDEDGGPVHHRFVIANHGYVPPDVLHASIEPPRSATSPGGEVDVVVAARQQHDDDLAAAAVAHHAQVLQVVVDGLGLAVSVGRLRPDEAASLARAHVARLTLTAPR
ncbi:hypothetical protein [uncultured Nocardioides sp.]|uniref:hypothetical protein n=1 Tax=uncultured Nocardioides sp. TaxID=198441 RepID=UPI0026349C89|nr:hypothetical protein [uncultured Nocardioides sp.]